MSLIKARIWEVGAPHDFLLMGHDEGQGEDDR